jgi:hypothetical protein
MTFAWTGFPDGGASRFRVAVLRRGLGHRCVKYISAKRAAGSRTRFVRAELLILPDCSSDLLMDWRALWLAVDRSRDRDGDELALAIDIKQPQPTQVLSLRVAGDWGRRLADAHGVAVQIVAHDPGAVGWQSCFHLHLLVSVRRIGGAGVGARVRDLLHPDTADRLFTGWSEHVTSRTSAQPELASAVVV